MGRGVVLCAVRGSVGRLGVAQRVRPRVLRPDGWKGRDARAFADSPAGLRGLADLPDRLAD